MVTPVQINRWIRSFPRPWGRKIYCNQYSATVSIKIGAQQKSIVLELDRQINQTQRDSIKGWLNDGMLRDEHIEDLFSQKVLNRAEKHFSSLERIIISPSRTARKNYLRIGKKALVISFADIEEQIYRSAFSKTRVARQLIKAQPEQNSYAVAGVFHANASVHDTVYMSEPMPIPGHELFARCLTRLCPIMVLPLEEKQEDLSSVMTIYLPGKGEERKKVINHIEGDDTFNKIISRLADYIGHYHLELALVTLMRRAGEFSDQELLDLEEKFKGERTRINLGEYLYREWGKAGKKTLARFNTSLDRNLRNFVPVLKRYIKYNSNNFHLNDLALLLLGAHVDKKIDQKLVLDYLDADDQNNSIFNPVRDYLKVVKSYHRHEEKRFFSVNRIVEILIKSATT